MRGVVGLSTLAEAIHVVNVQHANEMNLEYHHSRTIQECAAQDSHCRKSQDIYETLEAMEQSDNPVSPKMPEKKDREMAVLMPGDVAWLVALQDSTPLEPGESRGSSEPLWEGGNIFHSAETFWGGLDANCYHTLFARLGCARCDIVICVRY